MRTALSRPLLDLAVAASLTALSLLSLPLAAEPASPLLGRWRSLRNDSGGVGSVFEFRDGGAFDYSPANVVEMPYRIEDGELVLPPDAPNGPEHRQKIEWVGADRVRLTAPGTLSLELVRKAPAPASSARASIVGEWTGPRDMGGRSVQALYIFSPSGRVVLLMPFVTTKGRYAVDGEKIQMTGEKWDARGTFRVDGDTLTLSIVSAKGVQESKYARY
jgi:hypothetical protein